MAILLKFLMGGFAVSFATWLTSKIGGRAGGFLAGFPAVFTSALIVGALAHTGGHLDRVLRQMAIGGVVSLLAGIAVTLAAPVLFKHQRFHWAFGSLLLFWGTVAGVTVAVMQSL
ncbi:MAG: DUF3147 family protein [Firmicutes bacterium]|uniref:DUF3147 domain-containing protein n=1 Tax=Sulfobacillus benefaciens TaxID=453960 RepID=A0A2T2WT24_9FIRM|nr:DUF3147 family protein [Bacillota bacterium]MCL5012465.1 DUF3147 family protein [Bacillota bacterium]PSR25343.1 MAG: hypothetical protein C7B43_16970 [Sulfobacillus benefaciens]HBQ94537.1 hypothetical protein [Sulfobacillus sp.]